MTASKIASDTQENKMQKYVTDVRYQKDELPLLVQHVYTVWTVLHVCTVCTVYAVCTVLHVCTVCIGIMYSIVGYCMYVCNGI